MIKVKDVIILSLQMLGRADVSAAMEQDTLTDEQSAVIDTLVHCYNSVEDELARGYFPVAATQAVSISGGKFYYTALEHTPVKIVAVKYNSKPVKYRLTPQYIATGALSAEIEYLYCPEAKTIEDDGEYDGGTVSGRLLAYGVAAEYCLIQGAAEESACWESKYKLAIDGARRLSPERRYIPPRRWA